GSAPQECHLRLGPFQKHRLSDLSGECQAPGRPVRTLGRREIMNYELCSDIAHNSYFILRSDPPSANGVFGEAGDAVDVELAHDALAMGFDRANSHAEAAGNLLVAQPVGDPDEHLALTGGKLAGSFLPNPVHELIERQPRGLRAEEGPAR